MKDRTVFFGFPGKAVPLLRRASAAALRHFKKGRGAEANPVRNLPRRRAVNGNTSLKSPGKTVGVSDGVNAVMVSNAEIRKLNRRYRGVDRVTDVISFRLVKAPLLGEIYIARERSKSQAKDAGNTWNEELAYLLIHGILHLFDYTDYKPGERGKMFAVQDRLFKLIRKKK